MSLSSENLAATVIFLTVAIGIVLTVKADYENALWKVTRQTERYLILINCLLAVEIVMILGPVIFSRIQLIVS